MYEIIHSTKFKKDVKRCQKQNKNFDKFKAIHETLMLGRQLPFKNKDHSLGGSWGKHRECHIEPDWLLIYKRDEAEKIIEYVRMGSHAELFE